MQIYQRKPFKAKQWNKPGDLPAFAYGVASEGDGGCVLRMGDKLINVEPGDYICQRPDRELIYVCKRETFEANNAPIDLAEKKKIEKIHDEQGVSDFTDAMLEKMSRKRDQGCGGWWDENQCTIEHLRGLFMAAVAKGDMIDIANFAMMIYYRENS